jgi:hypothetical protein
MGRPALGGRGRELGTIPPGSRWRRRRPLATRPAGCRGPLARLSLRCAHLHLLHPPPRPSIAPGEPPLLPRASTRGGRLPPPNTFGAGPISNSPGCRARRRFNSGMGSLTPVADQVDWARRGPLRGSSPHQAHRIRDTTHSFASLHRRGRPLHLQQVAGDSPVYSWDAEPWRCTLHTPQGKAGYRPT